MAETKFLSAGQLIGIRTSIFTIFNPEKYDPSAISAAWQEFFAKAADSQLTKTSIYYGASIPSMSLDAPMDYFAGAIVESEFEVPEGFESIDIPEGNYLHITHNGPITQLVNSYQFAYMKELPESGKEMRPAPHLEIYNSDKDPMDSNYQMIIAIPVN